LSAGYVSPLQLDKNTKNNGHLPSLSSSLCNERSSIHSHDITVDNTFLITFTVLLPVEIATFYLQMHSEIEYRVRCFATDVQDPERHTNFVPGTRWWLATRTKRTPKDCLTFAEQIGIDNSKIVELYKNNWVSKINRNQLPFASYFRTRKFHDATCITVSMSNEFAEYGDERTCPSLETIVMRGQQVTRHRPWTRLQSECNYAGQVWNSRLKEAELSRAEEKRMEAEVDRVNELKRVETELARAEAHADRVAECRRAGLLLQMLIASIKKPAPFFRRVRRRKIVLEISLIR
jgi:hypothetical protein